MGGYLNDVDLCNDDGCVLCEVGTACLYSAVELGYNVVKGTEYFVSL
jgi:hypothetical protein